MHKLPKLIEEETDNLNKPCSIKEIESKINNILKREALGPGGRGLSFFGGIQQSPVNGCSQWVVISEFLQEKMSTRPSTLPSWNIPPKKDTPCPRAKEKPQQDGRRGEIVFRIKPYTHQRRLEGSNKPCAHQDPETPQRLSQDCVWVSPVEYGSEWPAQGQGSGCSRPEYGISLLGGGRH